MLLEINTKVTVNTRFVTNVSQGVLTGVKDERMVYVGTIDGQYLPSKYDYQTTIKLIEEGQNEDKRIYLKSNGERGKEEAGKYSSSKGDSKNN